MWWAWIILIGIPCLMAWMVIVNHYTNKALWSALIYKCSQTQEDWDTLNRNNNMMKAWDNPIKFLWNKTRGEK